MATDISSLEIDSCVEAFSEAFASLLSEYVASAARKALAYSLASKSGAAKTE